MFRSKLYLSISIPTPGFPLFFTICKVRTKGLLLYGDVPVMNCWFSFASVFQCSTPQGSPGVGRNTLFLSSPHLCFIIVFICDLFVSHDDPLMSSKTFTRTEQLTICFEP